MTFASPLAMEYLTLLCYSTMKKLYKLRVYKKKAQNSITFANLFICQTIS